MFQLHNWDMSLMRGCRGRSRTPALRAFMGSLTDVGDDLNIEYYRESPTLLHGYMAEPRAALNPLVSAWPQWEGKLPTGTGVAASLCHSTQLDNGEVTCEVQLWWGEPSDNLDGAVVQTLAGVMGGVTLLPQSPAASIDWQWQSVRDSRRYLAPFRSGRPQGPNVCFHIQRRALRCNQSCGGEASRRQSSACVWSCSVCRLRQLSLWMVPRGPSALLGADAPGPAATPAGWLAHVTARPARPTRNGTDPECGGMTCQLGSPPCIRGSPSGVRCRYSVDRSTPTTRAISRTGSWPAAMSSAARASLAPTKTFWRPPLRPRARAACSPACTRSRIRSRSNSAREAKRWKMRLPAAEVVSRRSCSETKWTPRDCGGDPPHRR